jgi:glycosyltransferase involved in cell wall biosynthesis
VSKKIQILLVSDVSIAEVIGGAERVLFEQAVRLQKRGHGVRIITRQQSYHTRNCQVISSVEEWRYRVSRKNALLFLTTTFLNCRKQFKCLQSEFAFGCLNFHQPFSALGVISTLAGKKIRKIYTCHSLSFEEYATRNPAPDGFVGALQHQCNIWVRKWIEKKSLKHADRIIVLSKYTRDKLCRVYGIPSRKIVIIGGGTDIERFRPAGDKTIIRNRLNIPQSKVVLFSVRNLVPRMGLENLIQAFSRVLIEFKDAHLVIGGEGFLKKNLFKLSEKLRINKNITFTGFITENDLPDYYRMADLFVLPTKKLEGFGLVTVESMASGVPVVGTPVGGTKEILNKFDPSFLFKDTTPESMAQLILYKIRIIKNEPERWKAISQWCRKFVEENYSWEKNVDELEKVMRE